MSVASPFVFVHGLFGPLEDDAIFRQLAGAPCSAPDLDGYGDSAGHPVTLAGQVKALRSHIMQRYPGFRVNLVGHSIGAVYAFTLADESPELIATITTVEGNFSLADAFWSSSIAALDDGDARLSIEARLADPAGFLEGDGILPTPDRLRKAEEALAYQPWRTVWESAIAVVKATGTPHYQAMLKRAFDRHEVYLVAGERSVSNWDVPVWARTAARGSVILPGAGHLMMLDQPEAFGLLIGELITGTTTSMH
ncbi:alpha/beta fold hydrolase [Arthrobacter sp. NPDC058192]|uniref:alpha/beta fold hydrolase n=1 Tax=Arthrobacter sp. NPDC058192 TaxID=3346372 RepID=UPI0036EF3EBF